MVAKPKPSINLQNKGSKNNKSGTDLRKLAAFIQTLENVQKIEILPYHEMGVYKWEHLGLDYALKGVTPSSDEDVARAKAILNNT